MKPQFLFLILLFSPLLSFSQHYSTFEDGTLEGWINSDASTTMLTVESTGLPEDYGQFMLQKECDGSNSPVGEMAIINTTSDWTGEYPNGDFDAFVHLVIYVLNDNDFDLHLRLGYMGGADNTKIISTESFVIPAFSDWGDAAFNINNSFTIISGESTIEEVLTDSHEVRIIHNDEVAYDGKYIEGVLKIDLMFSIFLLSNEDQDLSKTKLYPNPVNNIMNLKLPYTSNGNITFYNILGENVLSTDFSSATKQIDVSELKSGIYLAKIQTENQSTVKKIVKL